MSSGYYAQCSPPAPMLALFSSSSRKTLWERIAHKIGSGRLTIYIPAGNAYNCIAYMRVKILKQICQKLKILA